MNLDCYDSMTQYDTFSGFLTAIKWSANLPGPWWKQLPTIYRTAVLDRAQQRSAYRSANSVEPLNMPISIYSNHILGWLIGISILGYISLQNPLPSQMGDRFHPTSYPRINGSIPAIRSISSRTPSGKHTKSYWKWSFIVSCPIKNGDFP